MGPFRTAWCKIGTNPSVEDMLRRGRGGNLPSRDVAQPGSALAWGARGREFKSRRPDQSQTSALERNNIADIEFCPSFTLGVTHGDLREIRN